MTKQKISEKDEAMQAVEFRPQFAWFFTPLPFSPPAPGVLHCLACGRSWDVDDMTIGTGWARAHALVCTFDRPKARQ